MKFVATIWISYNFQIQIRIHSVETIHGNTVFKKQQKFSLLGKKLKFAATIWISYNFQIYKRIVSVETIWEGTVYSNNFIVTFRS